MMRSGQYCYAQQVLPADVRAFGGYPIEAGHRVK